MEGYVVYMTERRIWLSEYGSLRFVDIFFQNDTIDLGEAFSAPKGIHDVLINELLRHYSESRKITIKGDKIYSKFNGILRPLDLYPALAGLPKPSYQGTFRVDGEKYPFISDASLFTISKVPRRGSLEREVNIPG